MRRTTIALTAVILVATWASAWEAASDRAELELREARNRSLREEIEVNRLYAERRAFLEAERQALEEVAPAHARILPTAEVATDEKLLRDIQSMVEVAGVRILSVTVETKR